MQGYPDGLSNFADASYGQVDLIEATAKSVNTVYVPLGLDAGLADVVETAYDLGIPESAELEAVPSITLGTQFVRPVDMADVFATFAAGGEQADPYLVAEVTRDGEPLFAHEAEVERALEADVAADVTHALQAVLGPGGTAAAAAIGRPAAGKTGTTTDNTAAWFVGATPQLSTAVALFGPKPADRLRIEGAARGDRRVVPGAALGRGHDRRAGGRAGRGLPAAGLRRRGPRRLAVAGRARVVAPRGDALAAAAVEGRRAEQARQGQEGQGRGLGCGWAQAATGCPDAAASAARRPVSQTPTRPPEQRNTTWMPVSSLRMPRTWPAKTSCRREHSVQKTSNTACPSGSSAPAGTGRRSTVGAASIEVASLSSQSHRECLCCRCTSSVLHDGVRAQFLHRRRHGAGLRPAVALRADPSARADPRDVALFRRAGRGVYPTEAARGLRRTRSGRWRRRRRRGPPSRRSPR